MDWDGLLIFLGLGAGAGGGGVGIWAILRRLPAIVAAAKGQAVGAEERTVKNYSDPSEILSHEGLLEELWRLGVPAALLSADGQTINANDAMGRLFGAGPAALSSRTLSEVSVPDANNDEEQRQWSLLVSGQKQSYEVPLKSWRIEGGRTISGRVVVALIQGATWGAQSLSVFLYLIEDRTKEISERAKRVAAEQAVSASMTLRMTGEAPRFSLAHTSPLSEPED